MDEVLGFATKSIIIFIVFWYMGVNFFKHSHEVNSWLEKRRLQKLAEKHQDKIVDPREVFKKEFGFLGTAEYVRERLKEIKEDLADPESEYVHLNALEFIFLIDQLETQILKTDKGVYIVSKKNINSFVGEQEEDTMHYAKKMREYALRFLPNEGEAIVLNADEVLYWVRTGMLKRPQGDGDNKLFKLKTSLEESYLNLKEDFIEPHYSLSIVSHVDFLRIKDRREQIEAKRQDELTATIERRDELVDGELIVFSDNTLRMKIGDIVLVTNSDGKTHKEDLNGKVIADDGYSKPSVNKEITKDSFYKKATEILDEDNHINAKTGIPIMHSTLKEITFPAKGEQKVKTMFSNYQELVAGLKEKKTKEYFLELLKDNEEPYQLVDYKQSVAVSEKVLIDSMCKMIMDLGLIEFKGLLRDKHSNVNQGFLKKLYKMLDKSRVIKLSNTQAGSVVFSYKLRGKRYSVKSLRLHKELIDSPIGLAVEPVEVKMSQWKKSDYYIDFDGVGNTEKNLFTVSENKEEVEEKENADKEPKLERVELPKEADGKKSNAPKKEEKVKEEVAEKKKESVDTPATKPDISIKKKLEPVSLPKTPKKEEAAKEKGEVVEKVQPVKTSEKPEEKKIPVKAENKKNPITFVKKEKAPQESKAIQAKSNSNRSEVNIPKVKPKNKPSNANSHQAKNDPGLKKGMTRKTFIEKFCTESKLFSDATFEKRGKDCEQFYLTFRLKEDEPEFAEMYFSLEKFKNILMLFLLEEKVEHTNSSSSLTRFLRDGAKGDVSVRYFYDAIDGSAIKSKVVMVNTPVALLEGLRIDLGYRGGYRMAELGNTLKAANKIGDTGLAQELQSLSENIDKGAFIDCTKVEEENV